ncbi:MAG: hypothetical protein KQH63_09650 [Desulfobulbaceae bacterium]|nr:hypothetical protein [Desulfobulbaceae bacterium]
MNKNKQEAEMAFRKLPDNKGLIYIPEFSGIKKHPCPDCFSCQWCGNERCRSCRLKHRKNKTTKNKAKKKNHSI